MKILTFLESFPNEQSCKIHFINHRVDKGVTCKSCNHKEHYWLKGKEQFQCKYCGFRTTLKSGTVLQNSKLSFQYWYIAMHLLTSTKKTFSAHELKRQLGHKRYEPIWAMLHKLRNAMQQDQTLTDTVVLDDTYISTSTPKEEKENLKRGKGSAAKSKVTTMVETIPLEYNNQQSVYCGKIKLIFNPSEKAKETADLVKKNIDSKAVLTTDNARNFNTLAQFVEQHIIIDGTDFRNKMMKWTNVVITNLKRNLLGIFHCINEKYLQNYLNEFCFKFNNRKNTKLFDYLMLKLI